MQAVPDKIAEITAQAKDDDYIFRGEPGCYGESHFDSIPTIRKKR